MRKLEESEAEAVAGGGWGDFGEALDAGINAWQETGSVGAGWQAFKDIMNS